VTRILFILHVLAAVIALGPVTVAGSMFPAAARRTAEAPGSAEAVAAVRLLHRICRVYPVAGLAVPVFGGRLRGDHPRRPGRQRSEGLTYLRPRAQSAPRHGGWPF
jgi:hypothetical protein